ncbi:surfeit locus 1 family protein [Angomonas deanei]|nr:surfeit locus 1 family protein [Angomonas deanei]|eukprot:EPY26923.1 surfeit locus 1 family protein [Angomonas deanei]
MRPDYMGVCFLFSSVISFNAGIWQIFRRGQKQQLLENHKNLGKTPLDNNGIPLESDNDINKEEYRRVQLKGTLDNEGSCLVGPRSIPSYKGAAHTDEANGGFLIITPLQLADSKEFIMVNRGWVPIEAGKHRTMLAQYIGEGFANITVKGILRREEYLGGSFLQGENPDNHAPVAADLSWLVTRPFDMALHYYRKRWGSERDSELVKEHGAHHYYVEMIEDFSGDDQRIVRGHTWPRRRDTDEITYVHLTPIVHLMYVFFWFSISAGSLYGMGKCYRRQQDIFKLRKIVDSRSIHLEKKRQQEAQAYMDAMKEVDRLKEVSAAGAVAGKLGSGKDDSKK